jgi:hypothetical protein
MQFSLRTIQLIILTSSPTLASDYALPLHLVSRQSSLFCVPVFLLYPDTWIKCGNGYIAPDCSCCQGEEIGCVTQTQTCAMDATGGSICCDNTSPGCSSTLSGGAECETEGKVYCGGNGCLPAGYGCCPNNPNHGGCPLEQYCCYEPDGTPACCVVNGDTSSPSNTATRQSFNSLTSPTSAPTPTSAATPTPTESFNSRTGSSTTTSAKMTSNDATSTAISGPSSFISNSSSTRVFGAARGSHSFIFQSAMPFIVIYYFLLVGIFA